MIPSFFHRTTQSTRTEPVEFIFVVYDVRVKEIGCFWQPTAKTKLDNRFGEDSTTCTVQDNIFLEDPSDEQFLKDPSDHKKKAN